MSLKDFRFATVVAFFTLANIYSTQIPYLSILVTLIEYIIVYYLIVTSKCLQALIALVTFTSVSLDMNSFIYESGVSPFDRWTFVNGRFFLNILYTLTCGIIFYLIKKKYTTKFLTNLHVIKLGKWLKLLIVSGVLSICLGLVLNDNGILTSGVYPSPIFYVLLSFSALLFLMYSSIIIVQTPMLWQTISRYMLRILTGIGIATIISMVLGFVGYYAYYTIMLAPLVAAFTPCLLMFVNRKEKSSYIYGAIAIAIIVLAVDYPSPIGSKWYLLIAMVIVFCASSLFKIKSSFAFIAISICGLIFLPSLAKLILPYLSDGGMNEWKFQQAVGLLDFGSHDSFMTWFQNLDTSAKFRVDEPINIAIEYINKPYFALFGKGFAGTTLHYTHFCDWNDYSAFTEVQVKSGFYYEMHESLAVLFLRHGIIGLVFLFSMLSMMLKRIFYTPWAVVGFIWILFYWAYGISFRIGAIALVLTFCMPKSFLNNSQE